jgi:hypothetical protein
LCSSWNAVEHISGSISYICYLIGDFLELSMKLQKIYSLVCLAAIISMSAGCASSGARLGGVATSTALSKENKAGLVTIELNDKAREEFKDNLKFDQEQLRLKLEHALSAYELFDSQGKGTMPVVRVIVTDIRVRSSFSAVMWGAMAGDDHIVGEIQIVDHASKTLDHIKVSASYALGGIGGGQDEARMDWLYEAFVKESLKLLAGVQK